MNKTIKIFQTTQTFFCGILELATFMVQYAVLQFSKVPSLSLKFASRIGIEFGRKIGKTVTFVIGPARARTVPEQM